MATSDVPESAQALVAIYADESCLGNGQAGDNPGGAAGVIEYKSLRTGRLARRDYWVSEPATTNNRMALRSVIEGLRIISRNDASLSVLFTSDSQYLIRGINEWAPGWIAAGWRRKTGPIENLDLWREAVELVRRHRCAFRWVRGHQGHPQNEYANDLAVRAARDQSCSTGAVPSGFDRWIEAERERGALRAEPDPFPDVAAFSVSTRLPPLADSSAP